MVYKKIKKGILPVMLIYIVLWIMTIYLSFKTTLEILQDYNFTKYVEND